VGCAPGTLYLHFADKSAILGAICSETFLKLAKRMEAIRNDDSDPLERLRRGGRTYIQFGLEHPHHYLLTFGRREAQEDTNSPAEITGNRCFDGLRQCVRAAAEAGALRDSDYECVAQALWAASHGVVSLLIGKKGFPFVEQTRLIETALDITIEGIRAR
jgi:AcrR family transcriptional regulator